PTAQENRINTPRRTSFANATISSWIIEPQASFDRAIGKSKFGVLAGGTFQQNNSSRQQLSTSGYNTDYVMEDIKSATSISVASTIDAIYKYNAAFFRTNYNYNDKILINLTGRRDGSSRFGSANRFHNFAGLGAAWIFSEE